MNSIINDILNWSDDVGIADECSIGNELLVLQSEISELCYSMAQYYQGNKEHGIAKEIGDVFIAIINSKYIEYGQRDKVIDFWNSNIIFKRKDMYYFDVISNLINNISQILKCYSNNHSVSSAYCFEIFEELYAICSLTNLDLYSCIEAALEENIKRCGYVKDGMLFWRNK